MISKEKTIISLIHKLTKIMLMDDVSGCKRNIMVNKTLTEYTQRLAVESLDDVVEFIDSREAK